MRNWGRYWSPMPGSAPNRCPVFDAVDPAERTAHSVSQAELDCPAWRDEMFSGRKPASHLLAERLLSLGFAGMRYRSYAMGTGENDVNLVLWRWGSDLPSRVILIDDENRLSVER